MKLNRFSILLFVRLLLTFINLAILGRIIGRPDLFFNQLILFVVLLIQFYELLYFVTRTNRELAKFVLSIKEADFTATFSGFNDASFSRLYSSFSEILETIKQSRLEKEAQYRYLQVIINQIDVGIISFNEKEDLELMNNKASELLKIPNVRNWQQLKGANTHFFQQVTQLDSGDSVLIEIVDNGEMKQLTVNMKEVAILGQSYRVIAFKDIRSELDRKEIEAWHKLIRILTHEIMNSVTPMISLTETMKMLLEDQDGKLKPLNKINSDNIEDVHDSLQTIHQRSKGLLHFVDDYRKLTKIPVPVMNELSIQALVENVLRLLRVEFEKRGVVAKVEVVSQHNPMGDEKLLEQVFINLFLNAIQAVDHITNPVVEVKVQEDEQYFNITIKDNGSGIDEDKLNKVFIPFFSTKKDGSGIGLSLCQQIVHMHRGFIEIQSVKGEGTTITIRLPA